MSKHLLVSSEISLQWIFFLAVKGSWQWCLACANRFVHASNFRTSDQFETHEWAFYRSALTTLTWSASLYWDNCMKLVFYIVGLKLAKLETWKTSLSGFWNIEWAAILVRARTHWTIITRGRYSLLIVIWVLIQETVSLVMGYNM